MKPRFSRIVRNGSILSRITGLFVVLLLSCAVAPGQEVTPPVQTAPATAAPPASGPAEEEAPKIPNDQLDSLVAPIALYPDPLLAQTLAASTYPLEVIQLQQWMEKNKNLKDKALGDAVAKQKWDPSVQSLAAFPEVTKRMAANIAWTTDLGNAFLSQQADVMDAVQRMRVKAEGKGNLKTSKEQKVSTKKVEGNKEVIVIEQANPEVVYVPSYDPEVVYGPPAYPYYPYSYPGYYPGMGWAWGAGIILGAGIANGWWGDCDWNGGDININNNNNFNRNDFNRNNISNRPGGGNNNRWQHRPEHRGNAPYSNRSTNQKYGDRRSQAAKNRPSQQPNRGPGANRPSQQPNRGPGGDRQATNRKGPDQRPASNRSASNRNTSNRSSSANRPQNRSSNSIGNRQVSRSPSPRSNNAFSAPSRQMSRSSSFSSQSRGYSSMGGSRGGFSGGGRSMGGGGRGGGRRR